MRAKRLVWFLIVIALGIAGGITYGWMVNPVKFVDTPLHSLRTDYKADYVLMVAESYQKEQDLAIAVLDLRRLQDEDPIRLVQQAVITGKELGYGSRDMEVLGKLLVDLQSTTPGIGVTP